MQTRVVGLIDDTHAASAEFSGDRVMRKRPPQQRSTSAWRELSSSPRSQPHQSRYWTRPMLQVSNDGGALRAGRPHQLFQSTMVEGRLHSYDVSADGSRFLMV